MTALKGRDIEAFLSRPDPAVAFVLVYGPDAGLVSENAARLVRGYAGDTPQPESVVVLHMSEIETDAQRLGIEARTTSLFGGAKTIRIRAANGKLGPILEDLLPDVSDAHIIAEAGDLRPADALRKRAEARKDARALPCYADSGQSIDALIRQTFEAESITLETGLVPILRDILGNDRQITRRELEKLTLYADKGGHLAITDVLTLCGDNAALAIDGVTDSIGTGHARNFDLALSRALAAGNDTQRILIIVLAHFQRLRAMRAEIDQGAAAGDVVARSVPRVHFSRKSIVEQQLRLWSDDALANACARLTEAVAQTRKQPQIAEAAARQAMLAVCLAAARR
ncbi:DNA polymerase III subunit delta [Pelagibacterium montanilacus]|uniref:DNA polymerase III subunit delta n=1 Tax=Pelagibacterium montanilacus TaxID=2185280 RepID=UPI0013DF61E8|nr:DNA polymerase III subunit delta [Pelagibacterium montanilacus]